MSVLSVLIGFLISAVLLLIFRIMFAVSISLDAKARNFKDRTVYSILAFFLPLVIGIVYLCIRDNDKNKSSVQVQYAQNPYYQQQYEPVQFQAVEPEKPNTKSSIICFIIALVFLFASIGISSFAAVKEMAGIADNVVGTVTQDMYDMNGNKCEGIDNVPFYDKDGTKYVYSYNDEEYDAYYINQDTKEKYKDYQCYLDADGYFVYDENDEIEYDFDIDGYVDANGNVYHEAHGTFWDKDGNMQSYYDLIADDVLGGDLINWLRDLSEIDE